MHEPLNKNAIFAALPNELRSMDIQIFQTIDSTNNYAKQLIVNGDADKTLILAEHQTAGRGRLGRSFYSPAGAGLYFSLIMHPHFESTDSIQLVTVAAAVAVCRAISALIPNVSPQIKWVNDIFINGKKVCGILTEAVTSGSSIAGIVAGIGINCTNEAFPPELKDTACSIGKDISRNTLAAKTVTELIALMRKLDAPELIDEYRNRSYTIGRRVSFERSGIEHIAIAADINSSGNLIVRNPNGETLVLHSGEAKLI